MTTTTIPLFLEDLKPGLKFTSRSYALSTEDIVAFAEQYDPQPFHLSEEGGRNSLFKGLAASGWHTAAVAMRLLTESVPIAGGLIGAGLEKLSWFQPVRPNDSLYVETEVLSVRESKSKPYQGLARMKQTAYNQRHEAVLEFTSTIVVPKGP